MLLESAIGDAVGSAFEYAPPDWVKSHNDGKTYWPHPRFPNRNIGSYTDDTQMSLAVAEVMVDKLPWTKETFANKFVQVFKRDERTGYARNFYNLLKSVKDGTELLATIKPDSDKSGGAMRAPIIGYYKNIPEIIEKATIQASVTHNTPDGIGAAIASALVSHYFAYDLGSKKDLGKFIQENVPGLSWDLDYVGVVGAKGWMSVKAAITALKYANTLTEVLKASVAFTGDVDTVATISLAAGSMSREIENDLSQSLYLNLESGSYGRFYISSLDCFLAMRKAWC